MSDRWSYLFDNLTWALGSAILTSLWWRFYYHRVLRRLGQAPREMPLNLFVAIVTIGALLGGFAYDTASRLRFEDGQRAFKDYVHCQAQVNQTNVKITNDRTNRTIANLRAQNHLYRAQEDSLLSGGPRTIEQLVAELEQARASNSARISQLRHSALRPTSTCNKSKKAGSK